MNATVPRAAYAARNGLAYIVSFHAIASAQDAEGNFTTDWETVFGGTYSTGVALRWRTVRAPKQPEVIGPDSQFVVCR